MAPRLAALAQSSGIRWGLSSAEPMSGSQGHVDKPEPLIQAVGAVLAIGAIYLALPSDVVVGPTWLLPTLIVILLVPTIVSHRVKRHSINRILGFIISGITTLALIGSVALLVLLLPTHRESAAKLLGSGVLLWLTNVIVFALWFWRVDGGGPIVRQQEKRFGSTSLLFPQMALMPEERDYFGAAHWRPHFIDYLFHSFSQCATFGPTDTPVLARWAKLVGMIETSISLTLIVLLISGAVGGLTA